jgi:hypothetical protein
MSKQKIRVIQVIMLTVIVGSFLGLWYQHNQVCDKGDFIFILGDPDSCTNQGDK